MVGCEPDDHPFFKASIPPSSRHRSPFWSNQLGANAAKTRPRSSSDDLYTSVIKYMISESIYFAGSSMRCEHRTLLFFGLSIVLFVIETSFGMSDSDMNDLSSSRLGSE